jgi:flagellar protein FliO/FliZ
MSMISQTLWPVAGVLIGIIALIVAAARLYRFSGWKTLPHANRTLILRESIALDPRRRLHLVQCGQRQVVLLTGGTQDLVIGWMQDP